MIIIEAM